jgi:hypothetical protein
MKSAPLVLCLLGVALTYGAVLAITRQGFNLGAAAVVLSLPLIVLYSAFQIYRIQRKKDGGA